MGNKTTTTSPAPTTLWTIIATARAYEKALRKAYKQIVMARSDVFGESFVTSYGEVHAYGLAEGIELPADGRKVKARAATMKSLVAILADDRKSLVAAVGNLIVTATRHRRADVDGSIADIVADLEEARGIGVVARVKPYANDTTGNALADIVETARHTAAQARANRNDGYADDIIMLLADLRQTIWNATDGRPTIRHVDAAAIFTAVNALALAIEGR